MTMWAFLLIPMHGEGSCLQMGGGGWSAIAKGEEIDGRCVFRPKKVMDDIELRPIFFDYKKLAGNLTCGSPNPATTSIKIPAALHKGVL